MPPKPKTEEQLREDKGRIIDVALQIISRHGLEGLTMRKLSSDLHMSAANMYNYFFNKDEIYLYVLITGFNLLEQQLMASLQKEAEPLERLDRFMRSFIKFGMENKSYYELMFSTQDPKSQDYHNSPVQELAQQEKDKAMSAFALLSNLISEYFPSKSASEVFIISTRIACEMHGYIHLYHTNIIREIGAPAPDVLDNLLHHILLEFSPSH